MALGVGWSSGRNYLSTIKLINQMILFKLMEAEVDAIPLLPDKIGECTHRSLHLVHAYFSDFVYLVSLKLHFLVWCVCVARIGGRRARIMGTS